MRESGKTDRSFYAREYSGEWPMTQVFTSLAGQLVGLLTLLFALFPSLVSAANDAQPDSLESEVPGSQGQKP